MMNQPLVSAIVPTYNASKTIKYVLDSIINQTHKNIEIIVVDDGSSDGTPELVTQYPHVKLITQKNQGASVARNRGVAEATGEYIAFLDSDDLWHPQKIELQLQIAKEFPNFGIIGTDINKIKKIPSNKYKPSFEERFTILPQLQEINFYQYMVRTQVLPSAVLIRKVVFEAVGGFDPKWISGQDRELWLRISYNYPTYKIPIPLVQYYVGGGGNNHLSARRKLSGMVNSVLMIEQWFPSRPGTLDVDQKLDAEKFKAIYCQRVYKKAKDMLRYGDDQLFELYFNHFAYVFEDKAPQIKAKLKRSKFLYFFNRKLTVTEDVIKNLQ